MGPTLRFAAVQYRSATTKLRNGGIDISGMVCGAPDTVIGVVSRGWNMERCFFGSPFASPPSPPTTPNQSPWGLEIDDFCESFFLSYETETNSTVRTKKRDASVHNTYLHAANTTNIGKRLRRRFLLLARLGAAPHTCSSCHVQLPKHTRHQT